MRALRARVKFRDVSRLGSNPGTMREPCRGRDVRLFRQQKFQSRTLRDNSGVWSCRLKNSGVMINVKRKKCRTERCRKNSVVWSGRYEDGGVLCTTRTGWDDLRLQSEAVQDGRLQQVAVVRSCRFERSKVLRRARTGRDGQRQKTECAGPKAAVKFRRSEWQVPKRRSTVNNTQRMG